MLRRNGMRSGIVGRTGGDTAVARAARAASLERLETRRLLATTWEVDDDLQQCPHADFTSINAAVIAASPGDTIRVCPGRYNESVQVIKPDLTIEAERPVNRSAEQADDPADPEHDAIVDPPDVPAAANGFNVLADNTTIDGFVIEGATNNAGIYTSPLTSGHVIEKNLIRDNTFGIYLNSSGLQETLVRENLLYDNNRPGSASGNGIYTDQGLRNALIRGNEFILNDNSAIVLESVPPITTVIDVTIEGNRATDNGSFVAAFHSLDVLIRNNVALRSRQSGIFVGGGINGMLIEGNRLEDGLLSGIVIRDTTDIGIPGTPTDVTVRDNDVRNNGGDGISLANTSGHTIDRNQVDENDGSGIQLVNASNNTVSRNHVRKNGVAGGDTTDGIRVTGTSAGNFILGNFMIHNLTHDAHDDTVGPGTALTANVWEDNHCQTENRPGLCEHAH